VTGTVVALLLVLVPGWWALKCIGAPRRSSPFETLSLSYGLGLGAVAVGLFLLSWVGVGLSRGSVLLAVAALSALLWALRLERRRRAGERDTGEPPAHRLAGGGKGLKPLVPCRQARTLTPGEGGRPPAGGLEVFLLVLLILVFLSQAYFAVSTPLSSMDAMGFWGYSAKAIFFDGSIRTPALVDPLRGHPHPRYPLLVPLAQDWVHFLRGRYDDGSVRLLFVGFYAALVGVIYGTVRRRWGPRAALVAALLVATIPALRADGSGAAFAMADIPVAFFIAAALAGWVRWMEEGRSRDLLLAFIFAGLGAWTKNEGLAALAILTALVVVQAVASRRLMSAAGVLVVGWVLVVPWLLFRAGLPATDEDYPSHLRPAVFIANAGRLPTIAWSWLRELADASHWNILWLLAAVAGLRAMGRRLRPARWLAVFALAQLLVYTVVYVVAPWDIADLLELTKTRLLIHVMPAALLLCCLVVPEVWTAQNPLHKRPR